MGKSKLVKGGYYLDVVGAFYSRYNSKEWPKRTDSFIEDLYRFDGSRMVRVANPRVSFKPVKELPHFCYSGIHDDTIDKSALVRLDTTPMLHEDLKYFIRTYRRGPEACSRITRERLIEEARDVAAVCLAKTLGGRL